jgi:hypothetical protein
MSLSLFRRSRRSRRTALGRTAVAVTVACAALAPATPASATPSYSLAASIVGSGCTSQTSRIGWWGSNEGQVTMAYQPKGDVYVCWIKYRLSDRDPDGDYYSMVATSTWRHTAGSASFTATHHQSIRSSVTAEDNVWGSTPSLTSRRDCSSPFTVSYGVGPVSVSTTPALCSSHTVTRVAKSPDSAFWSSGRAGRVRVVETSLTQKVPQGVVPRFDVSFAIPQYSHTHNGLWFVPTARLVHQEFLRR